MNDSNEFLPIELAKQGDNDALNALLALHRPKLVAFLTRRYGRGGYAQDIEDVVQQTLLSALTDIDEFQGKCQFSTWLFTIAKNNFFNHIGYEIRRGGDTSRRIELDADVLSGADALEVSNFATPEEHFHATERLLVLDKQWASMPAELRDTYYLFALEQLSYQAIAQAQGIPVGTVRSRIHRARAHLGLL